MLQPSHLTHVIKQLFFLPFPYEEVIVLYDSNVQYKISIHGRKALCLTILSRLNPPHHMFDNMSTSASHLVLKQDVTIFSLGIRTIRPFCWALLCSTTLSLIIPARPMFDDTWSVKPIDDHVRRLGVVEYYVRPLAITSFWQEL
jgi:hypothetical protein